MEIWTILKDAFNYSISDEGRLKNNITGYLLKQKIDRYGYPTISYVNNVGKKRYRTIHRLVADNFIPNDNPAFQVNHKDGNKLNTRLSNFEWVTGKDNIIHSYETGLNGNTTAVTVTDLKNGKKYNYRSIKDLGRNIGISGVALIPYIKNSKNVPILDRYVIEIKDESLLSSRSNSRNFGIKIYLLDEIENKFYEYPSINLVIYHTGIKSLPLFSNDKNVKVSIIGYQISNNSDLIDVNQPVNIEELRIKREKYLSSPYIPRAEYYLLYNYYTKEEIKFNSHKEITDYINTKVENKVRRGDVVASAKSSIKYGRTGLIRGYGIRRSDVPFEWYPYKEEMIVCSQLNVRSHVVIYKVWKGSEYKMCLGHKALCDFLDYRYDRSWSNFMLHKESRFFNIPNLRIERLNKPIP